MSMEQPQESQHAEKLGGRGGGVKSGMVLDTFFFNCRLVGPDLYGSRFERIYMNHPSTGLRNESPAGLLTL